MHQAQIHGVRIARKAEAKVLQLRRDVERDVVGLAGNDAVMGGAVMSHDRRLLALEKWTGLYYARKLRAWIKGRV